MRTLDTVDAIMMLYQGIPHQPKISYDLIKTVAYHSYCSLLVQGNYCKPLAIWRYTAPPTGVIPAATLAVDAPRAAVNVADRITESPAFFMINVQAAKLSLSTQSSLIVTTVWPPEAVRTSTRCASVDPSTRVAVKPP